MEPFVRAAVPEVEVAPGAADEGTKADLVLLRREHLLRHALREERRRASRARVGDGDAPTSARSVGVVHNPAGAISGYTCHPPGSACRPASCACAASLARAAGSGCSYVLLRHPGGTEHELLHERGKRLARHVHEELLHDGRSAAGIALDRSRRRVDANRAVFAGFTPSSTCTTVGIGSVVA